jgi:hypothetical protein
MENWRDLHDKLTEPFEGMVKKNSFNNNNFIPNECYEYRAESIFGEEFKVEIIMFDINVQEGFVKMIHRIHLRNTSRDGHGFCKIVDGNISNAVSQAAAQSIRNGFDRYQMGWIDLGILEDKKIVMSDKDSSINCIKCGKVISAEELKKVKSLYKLLTKDYHIDCVPTHLRK